MKPQIDPKSDTWRAVEEWANERINDARLRNDSISADMVETSRLRGRIGTLKELLALIKAPAIEADESGIPY